MQYTRNIVNAVQNIPIVCLTFSCIKQGKRMKIDLSITVCFIDRKFKTLSSNTMDKLISLL